MENVTTINRIGWIDVAKGFAIIAVVVLHTDYAFPSPFHIPLRTMVGDGWHVALFFLVGGFFIDENIASHPVKFVKKKINGLYLPTVYFYLIAVLCHNLLFLIDWYNTDVSYGGRLISTYSVSEFLKAILASVFFAGREPILGAMWFAYVLFMALCGLSLIFYIKTKFFSNNQWFIFCSTLLLCVLSCTFTQFFSLTIPRLNNTLTAIWLVYLGYLVRNVAKIKFNNFSAFFASLVLFVYYCFINPSGVQLNSNAYSDVITFSIGSLSALYVVCYISQLIQNTKFGGMVRVLGVESFNIMALQFVGFKLCVYICLLIGIDVKISSLLAPTNNDLGLMFIYVLFGLVVPIVIIRVARKIKEITMALFH